MPPIEKLDRSYFFDYRSLAVARIILGLISILFFLTFFQDRNEFFTDSAYFTYSTIKSTYGLSPLIPLFEISQSEVYVSFLIFSGIVASLFIIVGKWTTFNLTLNLILFIAFCDRFPALFSPLDLALRTTYFWFIFLPVNRVWSLDSVNINSSRKKWIEQALYIMWIAQIIIIYVTSALEKLKYPIWVDSRDAIFKVLQISIYTKPLAQSLLGYPQKLYEVAALGTLALEGLFVFFLLLPSKIIRTILVFLFMFFHVCIYLVMEVGWFSQIAIAWWVTFLPDSFWNLVGKLLRPSLAEQAELRQQLYPETKNSSELAKIIFVFIFFSAICFSAAERNFKTKTEFKPFAYMLDKIHFRQGWWMFGNPTTLAQNGWLVTQASLSNGQEIDPFTQNTPDFKNSKMPDLKMKSIYTKKFFTKILKQNRAFFFQLTNEYFCNRWKYKIDPSLKIKHYEIYYIYVRRNHQLNEYKLYASTCAK